MNCNCSCDDVIEEIIQGDTLKRQISVIDDNKDAVDIELISKLELLLLDMDSNILETYELSYDNELEKWIVEINTENWAEGMYYIRYKITYVDTSVQTPKINSDGKEKTIRVKK